GGRPRRHHPRLERRGARGVRRAHARRLRSAPRLSLRCRLEPGPGRAADHPEDRAEPGAAAAARAAAQGGRMKDQMLVWSLRFLHPYRNRVAVLAALLFTETGLGALQPGPFAIVIDNVLQGRPFPEPIAGW